MASDTRSLESKRHLDWLLPSASAWWQTVQSPQNRRAVPLKNDARTLVE